MGFHSVLSLFFSNTERLIGNVHSAACIFLCAITLIVEDFSHPLKVLAELYNNIDTIIGGFKPMDK